MTFKTFDASKAAHRPGFTTYPFLHATGPMPWGAGSVLDLSKIDKLIFLSGETGRNPDTDREPLSWEEMRAGVGHCVPGGIKAQTLATWTRIKESLDGMGASMEDIVNVVYYLVNNDDAWDMMQTTHAFWREHAPGLLENRRAGTFIKGIKLDLPDMLIEIQVYAIIPKKG
jgi:enamine deaminase RidA (YjgF/YER057c/UK114 family)